MARVLAGFIGKPSSPPGEHRRYDLVDYVFEAEHEHQAHTVEARLFNCALLAHLKQTGRPVRRWLIMGTAQSSWDELAESVPLSATTEACDSVLELQRLVRADINANNLQQDLLDRWAKSLQNCRDDGIQVTCHITGDASTQKSQREIYASLAKNVHD